MNPLWMLKALNTLDTALESIELFCEYGTMDRPGERRDEIKKNIEFLKNNLPIKLSGEAFSPEADTYYYKG